MTPEEVYRYKADTDKLCRDMFDVILKVEAEAEREKEEECSSDGEEDYESCGEDEAFSDKESNLDKEGVINGERKVVQERLKDDVINDFFNRYAEVRSFRSRSALCHRQKYISVNSLLVMDKFLSGYVVTPKVVKYQNDHVRILEEVRNRSKRGKGWVVPYTFPVDKLMGCCCKGGVTLLVVPDSSSVRQLTTALRFNTMTCERRFFTDVSTSLGFVPQADAHPPSLSSANFFNTDNSKYCDFYENIIKAQEGLRACALPRFRARYAAERCDSAIKNLKDHASFFAGVWAICAKANLEKTVLSAVVSCPQEASYTLKGTSNAANNDSMSKHVARAVEVIGNRKQISIIKTFLEFAGCVDLVSMDKKTTITSIKTDQDFFLKLVNTYKRPKDCNGTHLWTLFSVMKRCFDNSLPLDWRKLLGNNKHLNLVPSVPNTDESGALFETARFISRCSELILGKTRRRLKECITREEWRDLLTGKGWYSKIALVYEKVMNTNDSRTTENFINSSTFLSNNNVSKKISINETKNEKIRQACWSSGESSLSMDERIDLLMAVERTNRDMTLSTVMMCCALYRLMLEDCRVEDITNKDFDNVGRFIPFIKSLSIVTATWNSNGGGCELTNMEYNTDNLIEVCAKNGRFVDIQNDPVFFYRFTAYTLGMLANNDQFFEDMTGVITESFDFNGVDTRNWNDFIEKHFLSFLLGRRAFLVSRPSAFIKRMVGSSNDENNNSESVRRLAKLMMVKAIDANDITLSDLVLCCIEDEEEDFVVRSVEEYQKKFYRFGKKTVKEANVTDSAMSSNACSNEQMSKKVKASRPQDVRVYFNKKSDLKAIERNEEEEADLSYGLYTDTVEKAVIKLERGGGVDGDGAGSCASGGGVGDDSFLVGERRRKSRQRINRYRENNTKNFNGKTEDIYDHSNRDDTSGTMSGFIAASNSMDGSSFMRETDGKFRKDTDFTEDDMIIANDNIVKRARKLMRQDKIKENICQMIDSMSEGLRIVCPFNSHDDPSLLGLSRTAANRVIDTVRAWNAIVEREAAVFKEECKEIEKSCTYDMRLVLCGDYTSEGINSGFGDEVHVFKTPLFDIVSAEGKRKSDVIIEMDVKKKKKKNDDKDAPTENTYCLEPPKDAIRNVNSDMLRDVAAFKKYEEKTCTYCQRFIGFGDGPRGNGILFKQRLHGDKILDPSLAAHFFSSNLIDPYLRSVVPRLMQHNAEHEGKVSLKRPANASGKNEDGKEGGSCKKKTGDDRINMFAFSSLNIIRTNSDLSRLKQCANENNSNLVSLYDNVSREQQVNGVSNIITKEDVRIPIRRGTVNGEEDYASVKALWLCNSGIHPRDQIEMFKKMVFRNYNKIWIKMYSEAMNVYRKWGVLTKSTIDRPFFSVKFMTMPVQVVDNNPPNAVLHSKFLSKDALADRVSATNSLIKLREYYSRSVGMTSIERFRKVSTPIENINIDVLDRAILCREFMTSMYDNRGSFVTSKFTNTATFVFTPGTSVEGRDYRGMGYAKDEDFVGKEEMLCTNSFNMCHGSIISALRYGVFEGTTSKSLEGGCNRVLRLYDNDMVLSSKSGSVNVVSVSNEASNRKSDSVMKKAAKDTIKDSNHTTRVKHSVYGHLTTHYSVINDNYNARNMLMSIRRVDRAAVENDNKDKPDEEKNKGADDLSLRYIMGRYRGYVFYADDFPSEQKHSDHLTLLKKFFGAIRDRNVNDFAIFSKEWLAISIVPEITRNTRMASRIKSCIRIDRRIDIGVDITFDDLTPKNKNRGSSANLRRAINRNDASVGFEKRGVSFLANPVVSMRWFLMRAHHLRLSCTNFGVASLSNFMGNRENKSTPMGVPPSAKSLATVFKMRAARNSCISMDNNRFFLIGGSYVLGGRLEGVNLITDMFVRCKLQTEKQIVHEALFDANVTTAFLATCMEGTAITRGVSMIEHISRLTNITTGGNSKSKNFWSLSSPHDKKKEESQFEYSYNGDASSVVRPPSVCIDDENYVILRMLYSVVSEMEDKKGDATASKVDRHVAAAIKKSYVEVLNQMNGLPNMHSLFHLRSIMNFCGFVNGICTGDGEKAHHLMHTLSAVGINMTPKTILAFIGVIGNNLKSSLVNIVKAGWWDMYTDLSADALVGKGDSSSTDAKFAYVAGKKNIFIMEEVGYQGSVKEKKSYQSGAGGGGCSDVTEDKTFSLDSINTRNIEVASSLWDRVSKRLKDNNMRLCESQTTRNGSLMALGKKRAKDEEDEESEEENEKEEATIAEPEEEEAVPSNESKTNDKKKKDIKIPMINMFSNKVGWWSHIKGPVFSEIGRDKAISCIISNSEVPFCTMSKTIINNSPWVRETDNILMNHQDIENKLNLYPPIPTPPAVVRRGVVGMEEEGMGFLDPISASASSSSSCRSMLNASEIKEKCLNLIKKEQSNDSFRPFSKMKELLMSVGYNEDNEWFIDENRRVLTPRRTSAGEAAANAANASARPAIFAMHAFSPSNYSQSIVKGFRRYYLDEPGEYISKRIGSRLSRPRKAAKAMYSDHQLKQTIEQTIAHIINFPSKYSFPVMTVDGSELFPIKPEASRRIVERFVRLNKTNLRGGKICKEITAISELASSSSSNGQQQLSSVFLSPDSFNVNKGMYETNGANVDFLDLMMNTGSHSNKLNVIERTFAAALENCDSMTGSNVAQESNLASSKMNRDSPFTEEMLPGQVSSNLVKQIASTDSIMSVRGLHGRPITCSVSATPVMISNSFLLRYYVDTAMYKRMLIFPFDTNFAPRNVEPNVELGDKIVRSGLKIIHACLMCKRSNMWSTNDNDSKKNNYAIVLKERLDEWNDLTGCCYGLDQIDSLVSLFPSVFLKHVMKTKVLELSDNSNLIKLKEACNTFFQSHASIMLSSRPNMLIKDKKKEEEDVDDDEQTPSHKQICTINSKTMDTLQMCIDRANSGGVWGLVNSALRSVLFVNAPFVDTKVLYGEGCTVKMMLDDEASSTINMSSGLRLPDSDGIGRNGTIGIGDALMRQLVGSWGTANIKNSMYSCHHLHTMFELAMQETTIQKRLENVGDMSSDYMSNVAFLLISSVYFEMFERFGVFASNGGSGSKRIRLDVSAKDVNSSSTYPVFMSMIVNKNIGHLNSLTNLADTEEKNADNGCHTRRIAQVLSVLGKRLNTMYLCPCCRDSMQ